MHAQVTCTKRTGENWQTRAHCVSDKHHKHTQQLQKKRESKRKRRREREHHRQTKTSQESSFGGYKQSVLSTISIFISGDVRFFFFFFERVMLSISISSVLSKVNKNRPEKLSVRGKKRKEDSGAGGKGEGGEG